MRIDKWLFVARFFKSRTLAADACEGGKVDVNGQAAKPARAVRPGDRLDISLPAGRRVARIAGLAPRRGSGADARELYEDLTPPSPPSAERRPPVLRPPGAGRPTKRDRRVIDRATRRFSS